MWAVTELRQHTLHPGARPAFVSPFEREFVDSRERLGIGLLGQFEDRDDPDRFVWIRSFRICRRASERSRTSTADRCGRRTTTRQTRWCAAS
jgi:hypothetical protein